MLFGDFKPDICFVNLRVTDSFFFQQCNEQLRKGYEFEA